MITKQIAEAAGHIAGHGEFWHMWRKNADGTPLRCRVNGKVKTWKREPDRWILPIKTGLKTCFYIASNPSDVPNVTDIYADPRFWCRADLWEAEHELFRHMIPEAYRGPLFGQGA